MHSILGRYRALLIGVVAVAGLARFSNSASAQRAGRGSQTATTAPAETPESPAPESPTGRRGRGGRGGGGLTVAPTADAVDETPVVTHHTIEVGDKTIKYTATCQQMPLKNAAGETEAHIFYMAYTLDDADHSNGR